MIKWQPITDRGAHINVRGSLDAHKAPSLRACFREIGQEPRSHLYLDLSEIDFMDSAGLAAIVSGLKRARAQGGELYLVAPSSAARQILEYTLLDSIIPIITKVDEVETNTSTMN